MPSTYPIEEKIRPNCVRAFDATIEQHTITVYPEVPFYSASMVLPLQLQLVFNPALCSQTGGLHLRGPSSESGMAINSAFFSPLMSVVQASVKS